MQKKIFIFLAIQLIIICLIPTNAFAFDGIEIRYSAHQNYDRIFVEYSPPRLTEKVQMAFVFEETTKSESASLVFDEAVYLGFIYSQIILDYTPPATRIFQQTDSSSEKYKTNYPQLEVSSYSIAASYAFGFFIPIGQKSRFLKLGGGVGISQVSFSFSGDPDYYYANTYAATGTLFEVINESSSYKILEVFYQRAKHPIENYADLTGEYLYDRVTVTPIAISLYW